MRQFVSDIARRLHNVVTYGRIAEVDYATGRVRVDINGRLSGWLPTPGAIGQNFRAWMPCRVGTQVQVSAPSGDPANGVISQILYSQALPPPATDGNVDVVEWNDGTRIAYDSAAQRLTIVTPGNVAIEAAAEVTITTPTVTINGNLEVAGSIHASGSIIDDSGNTPHHNH